MTLDWTLDSGSMPFKFGMLLIPDIYSKAGKSAREMLFVHKQLKFELKVSCKSSSVSIVLNGKILSAQEQQFQVLYMGLINKVDMVCLSPVGYGV